jgi:hypothetical protein
MEAGSIGAGLLETGWAMRPLYRPCRQRKGFDKALQVTKGERARQAARDRWVRIMSVVVASVLGYALGSISG